MKKKFIYIGLTCCFLLIAGICYSCSKKDSNSSTQLISSLDEGNKQNTEQNDNDKFYSEQNDNNQKMGKDTALVENKDAKFSEKREASSDSTDKKSFIYVHICGSVKKPGVYRAEEGTRLYTFVKLAGGFTKKADANYMNQAKKVSDGQRIYIPTKKEVKELSVTDYLGVSEGLDQPNSKNDDSKSEINKANSVKDEPKSGLININEANAEELMEIPGIGQAKADKIIEYRNTNGTFNKIEDIMKISGIKEGLFQKMAPYITV